MILKFKKRFPFFLIKKNIPDRNKNLGKAEKVNE
jgi:hypothetical protein